MHTSYMVALQRAGLATAHISPPARDGQIAEGRSDIKSQLTTTGIGNGLYTTHKQLIKLTVCSGIHPRIGNSRQVVCCSSRHAGRGTQLMRTELSRVNTGSSRIYVPVLMRGRCDIVATLFCPSAPGMPLVARPTDAMLKAETVSAPAWAVQPWQKSHTTNLASFTVKPCEVAIEDNCVEADFNIRALGEPRVRGP